MSYELRELVESGYENFAKEERLTAAQKNELKESKKKDARALFLIQQAMDEPIFPRIMAAATSKEAWDLLQEEYQVAAIEESKDLTKYSMNELMGSWQAHEQRLNRTIENPREQAFQSKVDLKKRSDDSNKSFRGGRGRGRGGFRGRGRDSGCSNHMTGNKDYFLEIDETIKLRVRMCDNNHVNAHGIGPIVISTMVGKKQIQDVMYVPGLAQNLLSLGKLIKRSTVLSLMKENVNYMIRKV
ncbi:uncharacterized protein LOC143883158 [Tasmannia lanceolata]|uniref:uncharacterized protein LOC143883158 n=1 Tax=Tasmannia lanceolata TaxID=3420 RepID=UPI004063750F